MTIIKYDCLFQSMSNLIQLEISEGDVLDSLSEGKSLVLKVDTQNPLIITAQRMISENPRKIAELMDLDTDGLENGMIARIRLNKYNEESNFTARSVDFMEGDQKYPQLDERLSEVNL